jgi:hypothetical protein
MHLLVVFSRSVGRKMASLAGAAVLGCLVSMGACVPDLPIDRPPDLMEFDPSATPPRSPEPTVLVINQQTGLIDFSVTGLDIPPTPGDCADSTLISPAECEFDQYLERLDGFPTLSPVRTPTSAPLDLATVTVGADQNLFIVHQGRANPLQVGFVNNVDLSFDASENYLHIDNPNGWEPNKNYVFGIRGYENGVRAADGNEVVSSTAYFLLKQEVSLLDCQTVDASDVDPSDEQIDETCMYYELLEQSYDSTEIARASLYQLEAIRRGFLAAGLWGSLESFGGLPKAEIAIVWAFPTHSGPVVELNPAVGIVPQLVSNDTVTLAVKGTLDASTITAFGLGNLQGTVALFNFTKLQSDPPDLVGGLPAFDVTYADDTLTLVADATLIEGDRYGIILVTPFEANPTRPGLLGENESPLVASPVTVFLRNRYPLVDGDGHSLVPSKLDDASAAQLEAGRATLGALFEDPQFGAITGLTRENVAYVYAFDFVAP